MCTKIFPFLLIPQKKYEKRGIFGTGTVFETFFCVIETFVAFLVCLSTIVYICNFDGQIIRLISSVSRLLDFHLMTGSRLSRIGR